MALYKNIMEQIVEDKLDQIYNSIECCTCQRCRDDIIAYALNQLPSQYVVTYKGEVYSKICTLQIQHEADIMTALIAGANIVRQNPLH